MTKTIANKNRSFFSGYKYFNWRFAFREWKECYEIDQDHLLVLNVIKEFFNRIVKYKKIQRSKLNLTVNF